MLWLDVKHYFSEIRLFSQGAACLTQNREQVNAVIACGYGAFHLTDVSLDCSNIHVESALAFAGNLRARLT